MSSDPSTTQYFKARVDELAALGIAHKRKWKSLETGRTVSTFTQTFSLMMLPAAIIPAVINPALFALPVVRAVALAVVAGSSIPSYVKGEYYTDDRINGHKKAALDICGFLASANWKNEIPDASGFVANNIGNWPLMHKPPVEYDWRDID